MLQSKIELIPRIFTYRLYRNFGLKLIRKSYTCEGRPTSIRSRFSIHSCWRRDTG